MNKISAANQATQLIKSFVEHQQIPVNAVTSEQGTKIAALLTTLHKDLTTYLMKCDE